MKFGHCIELTREPPMNSDKAASLTQECVARFPVGEHTVVIRPEAPSDYREVREVNEIAFGQADEADLVDALRLSARPYISLVAVGNDRIIGHIFFSPIRIDFSDEKLSALALAPISVLPGYQEQGVGTHLVQCGLKLCRQIGFRMVVVVGHHDYYPRFGFERAVDRGLVCEFSVPDEAFMVAELIPGVLKGRRGVVRYLPEFSKLDAIQD